MIYYTKKALSFLLCIAVLLLCMFPSAYVLTGINLSAAAADSYEITFQNSDKILQVVTVPYGEIPVYSGEEPKKEGDSSAHYVFSGWDPALSAATSDMVYNAQFTSYTHNFQTVSNGEAEDGEIPAASPEQYVYDEAQAVTDRVLSYKQEDSLILGCASDSHYASAGDVENIMNAGKAMNYIKMRVGFDGFCNLGDYTTGARTTTKSACDIHFQKVKQAFADAAFDIPNYWMIGNHDVLPYNYKNTNFYTQAELYQVFGKNNTDDSDTGDNYGFHDYEKQKIRVIYLNTCDSEGVAFPESTSGFTAFRFSAAQLQWFTSALDLSSKNDADDWGIILMGHYPPGFWLKSTYTDTNGVTWQMESTDLVKIINAYTSGSKVNLSHDGVNISYDYTGKNQASVICFLNGHTHNFVVGTFGTAKIPRITIPNSLNGRENEYTNKSGFFEETAQKKTANTRLETSFNVVVVNKNEKSIHLVNYGAGYDRTVKYGESTKNASGLTLYADNSSNLYPGKQININAQLTPDTADDKDIRWSVSDTSVAVVSTGSYSNSAVLTARNSGSVTVTAKTASGISAQMDFIVGESPSVNYNINSYNNKWINPNTNQLADYNNAFTTSLMPCDALRSAGDNACVYIKFLDNSVSQIPAQNRNPWYVKTYYADGVTMCSGRYLRSLSPHYPIKSVEFDNESQSFKVNLLNNINYYYIQFVLPGKAENILITFNKPPTDSMTHSVVCADCGYKLSDSAHNLVYDKNAQTHRLYCTECDYTQETETHLFDYSYDSTTHSSVCKKCGYAQQTSSHFINYSQMLTTHIGYCPDCGYTDTAHEHSFSYINKGQVHDYLCDICGYVKSSSAHNLIMFSTSSGHGYRCQDCGYEGEINDHNFNLFGSEADHRYVCNDCGYEKAEAHSFVYYCDSLKHWQNCSVCSYVSLKTDHTFDINGICTACGYESDNKADYTKVDKALSAIPADLTIYTESTVSALNEAVNAVVRNLYVGRQSDVDAMAENISRATSSLKLKAYTVTFKSGEEVLQTADVEHGTLPAYTGAEPHKESDAENHYTFSGWTPEIVAASQNAEYTAQFTASAHNFNADGKCLCGYAMKKYAVTVPSDCTVSYKIDQMQTPYYLVTVQAPKTNSRGDFFTYWIDSNGDIVGTYRTYTFFSVTDVNLTPVYFDSLNYQAERQKAVMASRVIDARAGSDDTVCIFAEHSVSTTEVMKGHGVIVTANAQMNTQEYMNVFNEDENVYIFNAKTSANAMTGLLEIKAKINSEKIWARPYIIDGNGEYHYGRIIRFDLGAAETDSDNEIILSDNISYDSVQESETQTVTVSSGIEKENTEKVNRIITFFKIIFGVFDKFRLTFFR